MKYLAMLFICAGLTSCGVIKGSSNFMVDKGIKLFNKVWPEDNIVEESIEDGVEAVSGLEMDFSPCSPEIE